MGPPINSGSRLQDRAAEREALDRLIGNARAGTSGVVVLRGEAGAGKSALLDYLRAHAAGCRVARATGIESEMELAFAGLHQLCAPFLDRLDRLPTPQGDALGTAFGVRAGDPPDRFLVGLAVLSLLSDVAEDKPLVCIIDDSQWLDRASAQVLGFVARRLAAEAVVLVFALREPSEDRDLIGLPELPVGPLRDADARAILAAAIPDKIDEAVRDRIIAEAHGNPLALLELPRGWTREAFAGGFGTPDGVSVSARIEESFRRRLTPLPIHTRLLMLVVAADPAGDPVTVRDAADRLGIPVEAAGPARQAGLVDQSAQLRFRHPLVRSVVYREATPGDRRLVHRALAAATDPAADSDRRAWHLAAAAAGPDEEVAAELERSAGRARARGGPAAAAAFLQRAVSLTSERARRAERAFAAAQASLAAAEFDAARALLEAAEAEPLDELQRARLDVMRAQLAFISNRGNGSTPLLLAAARRLEPLDGALARETYLDAFSAALFGARLNVGVGIAEVAAAARSAPPPPSDQATSADLLLNALVALTDDYGAAVATCRAALRKLSDEISAQERLRWLWQGGVIALELWDDETASSLSHRNVQIARDTGTLTELALALDAYTPVQVLVGQFAAAASGVAETESVEQATGIRSAPYGALMLAAWRGLARKAHELIDTTIRQAGARGEGIGLAVSEYARAVLCNGLSQYEEAAAAALSASEYGELVVENWGLSELVEPAARIGRNDLATDAVNRLAAKASATGSAWALGIETRSRALLSHGHGAEALFREAVEYLSRTQVRAEVARTHLLFGEWLRREGRRVDARGQLRTAYDMLTAMGMDAFAERARHELLATGERVPKRTAETRNELTPQEEQIARLARGGLSNAEIGARLFLSPRTVEWHLRKVFSKLGVSSRRELGQALPYDRPTGIAV